MRYEANLPVAAAACYSFAVFLSVRMPLSCTQNRTNTDQYGTEARSQSITRQPTLRAFRPHHHALLSMRPCSMRRRGLGLRLVARPMYVPWAVFAARRGLGKTPSQGTLPCRFCVCENPTARPLATLRSSPTRTALLQGSARAPMDIYYPALSQVNAS